MAFGGMGFMELERTEPAKFASAETKHDTLFVRKASFLLSSPSLSSSPSLHPPTSETHPNNATNLTHFNHYAILQRNPCFTYKPRQTVIFLPFNLFSKILEHSFGVFFSLVPAGAG